MPLCCALPWDNGIRGDGSTPEAQNVIGSENLCGQNSLLLAALFLDTRLDPEVIDSNLGVRERAVTMLELHDAAERLGFACLALHWEEGLEIASLDGRDHTVANGFESTVALRGSYGADRSKVSGGG